MKTKLVYIFLTVFVLGANAAPPISGRITDTDGLPLIGATVEIKGTTSATKTDENGNFSLDVSSGQTLVVSFIGYQSREVQVEDLSAPLTIQLIADDALLDEVVVVSYGTQKKREITGAISDIDADKLKDQPVGQLLNKLQGRLAGVQISQTSGTPGQGMSIKIRGAASIGAGNNPLYVIDGVPIVGGAFGIGNINPNEIENISVLKDASAASLYGSRAANGVVLITTKKAKAGQTNVTLSALYGLTNVPQKGRPELMNAEEWVQFQKEIYEDKARYEGYEDGVPEMYQDPSAYRNKSTDWYDALLRPGRSSDYSLSIATNKDKFSSTLTAGYFKQDGVLLNTDYSRFSLRSNNEYNVNDHIKIGTNISATRQSFQSFNTDGGYQILFSAFVTPPIFSPFDTDETGNIKTSFSAPGILTQPNWYRTLTERIERTHTNGLLTNSYLAVTFLKDFRFKSTFGVELEDWRNRSWRPSTASGDVFTPPPTPGAAGYNTTSDISWVWENNVTYSKTFAEDHQVEVLVGYSAQRFRREYNEAGGSNFSDDLIPWISGGLPEFRTANSGTTQWSLLGEYARLNYNFQGKYLLNAAIRRDGSSRFGVDDRWGSFPSLSLGWIVTEEKFAQNWGVFDYLKLRAGYGVTGNFNIGDFLQYPNIGQDNYPINQQITIGRPIAALGNSLLTWETTKGSNLGADLGFFNDRIAFSFDYYDKVTEGLLYNLEVPASSGFGSVMSNIGKFKLWGYEFALTTQNLQGKLNWTTDINVSINRTKVIQLGANNTPIGGINEYGDSWKTEIGRPMGQFWGYVYDGIYMTEEEFESQPRGINSMVGTVRFKDINGDGVINADDRTYIGNPNPKFVFGINNTLTYKNFDFNIVATGAVGGDIFDGKAEWLELIDGLFNTYSYVKDRWRSPENPGAGIIGRTSPGSTTGEHRKDNSRYVHDGTYLTIKNIALGYTYPQPFKSIGSIRAFLSIQQAFVFSSYANPEVSANGLNGLSEGKDAAAYPIPRIFSLGINVNF
ncbi:SusC/RagA family TonB-linked outer membrane protein [Parapedobacter sp. GCM10030251]|uniref:SusC/RagA family TonB-linked outer membrane protein n=1 Tax=Parapedobacter sp. GCM10030251 TaxID=3273419 RepID=UPI00361E6774